MKQTPLLEIQNLSIGLKGDNIEYDIVRNVNFTINENEILAIVGESGCGKSLTALSILVYMRARRYKLLVAQLNLAIGI